MKSKVDGGGNDDVGNTPKKKTKKEKKYCIYYFKGSLRLISLERSKYIATPKRGKTYNLEERHTTWKTDIRKNHEEVFKLNGDSVECSHKRQCTNS